jgi:3'-phosphoadenosine 5'-phosphosulfate sulfotransferase (PAPS reductase)/FAD synthetase
MGSMSLSLFHRAHEIIPDALYVINHSGGKDSQAMFLKLRDLIPKENLVVIHAHLPEVEWEGTIDHIKNTIGDAELHVVQAGKTFFEMVEHRQMWPSPSYRQCTSDLKRGPINKKIIELCNERGYTKVVNCMGLRAAESANRSRKDPFKLSGSNSNSKRTWYEWLPIFEMSTQEVFGFIKSNNQTPHWAYEKGMTRLSCVFCIMSSKHDLETAARLNPELKNKYATIERKIDHTFVMPTKKSGRVFLDEMV